MEQIVELQRLVMDCSMEGERCDELAGTAIWYTVYILSNETIILTEEGEILRYLVTNNCLCSNILFWYSPRIFLIVLMNDKKVFKSIH